MIPYGHQHIDEEDLKAVAEVLTSDFLTTGPAVGTFEERVAAFCGAEHAVAVSSGTAALHVAMLALGIGPGDEVIVPPITFVATANCARFVGATPVFADVDENTLLIDPESVESKITSRTRAIIAVDYAGQPCDWTALNRIARQHGLKLVADACHAIGATYESKPVGTHADMTIFSFHPVKQITTGEGGLIATNDPDIARQCRLYRNHGITTDSRQRDANNAWFYEMTELGFNYRMTDIQAALGTSQLKKLPGFLERRREIAARYDALFAGAANVEPLEYLSGREHAYHLYVVKVADRDAMYRKLRAQGVGVNVHYIPVHLQPYYRRQLGTGPGDCPVAEAAYERILSLPMFPDLADADVEFVAGLLLDGK
jgi:perosamine synthetase